MLDVAINAIQLDYKWFSWREKAAAREENDVKTPGFSLFSRHDVNPHFYDQECTGKIFVIGNYKTHQKN